MKNIVLTLVCMIFLVVSVSALSWDNQLTEKDITFDGKLMKNNKLLEKYPPVEIKNSFGFGETLFEGYLSQHTHSCGSDCSSTIEINLLEDGALVDNVVFKTLKNNRWIEQPIRNYQFYVNGEFYELGTEVKAGIYQVRLEGQKKSYLSVDWIIQTNGEWIDEWAVWGNISTGAEAQVFLMDPPDDNVSINYYNNLSCSALSNTSYIVNMSLYTNVTGSWEINQTANYSSDYVVWIIADDLTENNFSINTCSVQKINNSIWKLTSSESDYEVQRAKIMQTLFYDGSILNATNVQKLITSDNADIGMRGHYITYSHSGDTLGIYNGTFAVTTNNLISSWSTVTTSKSSSSWDNHMRWEVPQGTTLNTVSSNGAPSTNNEIGTDLSTDEKVNPVSCELQYVPAGDGTSHSCSAKVIIVGKGAISWTEYGTITTTEVDYTADHAIPEFSGNESYESFNINIESFTEWACQACDGDGDCGMSVNNHTISTELTVPEVSITYPTEIINFQNLVENETLNWTISDPNLDACWYDYNDTNITVTCNDNSTNFTLVEGWNNITLWANDTFGNINSSYLEWTYKILQNSAIYNSLTYETASETFSINVTANASLTDVDLIYNGVSHDTTLSGGLYNVTFDIPNSVGNKTFYWDFTYAGAHINSTIYDQYVNNTLLGVCNATLTVPYINFTFMDEETLTNINATIDTSTWSFYLGSGTVTKSLIFSNTTANDNYAFCFSASNDTIHNTRSIQYASPGYPQRKYDASSDLTNATTNKTLYLLSSSDGIYTTIQVVDQDGDRISGVEVTAERQFSGVWTVIGQETTDSAGSVTFWVNPDYDHRFTFISDDCTDATVTIRPTQTQYTQQLQCVGEDIYVAQLEGIKYARTPFCGIVQAGTYNFSYQIVSTKDNIINASFYIVNASDQTVLNSSVSSCNPEGCTLYLMHVVNLGDDIKARYYVDVGNGSILLEGDARWRCILIPTGSAGVRTLVYDIIFIFQEWGDNSDTADFNRLVCIFFFMCISISALNYHFNMDSLNPGMFLFIMTFIIIIGSLVGGTSPSDSQHGLFYYNNLTSNGWFNNYILAGICFLITASSFININKQAQR